MRIKWLKEKLEKSRLKAFKDIIKWKKVNFILQDKNIGLPNLDRFKKKIV